MNRVRVGVSVTVLLLAPLAGRALTVLQRVEPKPLSWRIERLFPASSETVRVVVTRDERLVPWLLASHAGKSGPYNLYQGFYNENARAVADLFEAGGREAVEVLGMKAGDGGATLEITIKDFRIQLAPPQFGLPNYITYGDVRTALKSADGADLGAGSFRVANWETSRAPAQDVVSAAYLRAAWEATVRTLLDHFPKKPEPEAIARLLASLETTPDEYRRVYPIFWLGLVARDEPAVVEKLYTLFRANEDQTTYEAAAVALARLSAPGAREEFEAMLAGSKKWKEWDPRGDAEEAFVLLHSLALLGVTDLGARVPPTLQRHREKMPDLVRFHSTGEIPKPTPKELEELTEKYQKYEAKRKR